MEKIGQFEHPCTRKTQVATAAPAVANTSQLRLRPPKPQTKELDLGSFLFCWAFFLWLRDSAATNHLRNLHDIYIQCVCNIHTKHVNRISFVYFIYSINLDLNVFWINIVVLDQTLIQNLYKSNQVQFSCLEFRIDRYHLGFNVSCKNRDAKLME